MTLQRSHPRAKHRWLVALVSVAILPALTAGAAFAILKDGSSQFDRNVTSDARISGDDWDRFDDGSIDPNNDYMADALSFVVDGRGPTIFTGGGSKDDLNTTGWKHKSGAVPDKDELLDAYAARYGDVLYFGADRYDANGAAALGFWFFQQDVGPSRAAPSAPAQHADGDILILSDFSVGGATVTIRVFQWNGPGGTTPVRVRSTACSTSSPVQRPGCRDSGRLCRTARGRRTGSLLRHRQCPRHPVALAVRAQGHRGRQLRRPAEFYEGGIDLGAFPELAGPVSPASLPRRGRHRPSARSSRTSSAVGSRTARPTSRPRRSTPTATKLTPSRRVGASRTTPSSRAPVRTTRPAARCSSPSAVRPSSTMLH